MSAIKIDVATAMARYYAADKARAEARKVLEGALAAEAKRAKEERDSLRTDAACYIGDVHPLVTAVCEVVAEHFGLTLPALTGKRQDRDLVQPRHVAIALCREYEELCATVVARGFGMKGTGNVLYAQRMVSNRLSTEAGFNGRLAALRAKVEAKTRVLRAGKVAA